jgi:hypothetical protein
LRARARADDLIPIVGFHRGVGLHDQQSPERLELVKAEIDFVFDSLTDLKELADYAGDMSHSPESRLLAGALVEARWQLAAEDRRARPTRVDLDVVRASVCSLNSQHWRSPWAFCSLLDPGPAPGAPGPAKREAPLR